MRGGGTPNPETVPRLPGKARYLKGYLKEHWFNRLLLIRIYLIAKSRHVINVQEGWRANKLASSKFERVLMHEKVVDVANEDSHQFHGSTKKGKQFLKSKKV